jgi:uncharacterized protein
VKIMGIFFKRQNSVINKIEQYFLCIDNCVEQFIRCINTLIRSPGSGENYNIVCEVHKAESEADDYKRKIELHLYEKALIPESRGDVLGIIESLDKIPNVLESICFQIYLQKIKIIEEYRSLYEELIEINIESYKQLKKAVNGLFYNSNVMQEIEYIDRIESESDKIERLLIEKIFNSELDKAEKLLLKEIVVNTGNISDRAQATADRLTLAVIKRRI